jgi:hypothetical protein
LQQRRSTSTFDIDVRHRERDLMKWMSWSSVVGLLLSACSFEAPVLPGDPGADAMGDSIDSIDPDPDPEPKAWLDGWARRKPITLSASQIEAPGDGAAARLPMCENTSSHLCANSRRR